MDGDEVGLVVGEIVGDSVGQKHVLIQKHRNNISRLAKLGSVSIFKTGSKHARAVH